MREVQVSNLDRQVFTLPQFGVRNGLSMTAVRALMRANRGPRVMRPAPNIVIVTPEAEQEWRRMMEAEAESEAAQLALARQRRHMSTLGKMASKHPGHPAQLAKAKAKPNAKRR
jgi:hypothetical protein